MHTKPCRYALIEIWHKRSKKGWRKKNKKKRIIENKSQDENSRLSHNNENTRTKCLLYIYVWFTALTIRERKRSRKYKIETGTEKKNNWIFKVQC